MLMRWNTPTGKSGLKSLAQIKRPPAYLREG